MADFPNAYPIINKQEQRSSNGYTLLSYIVLLRTLINEIPGNLIYHTTGCYLFHRIQWVGGRPPRFLILRRRYCQDWYNRITTEVVAHLLWKFISTLPAFDFEIERGYLVIWICECLDPRYFRDRICLINRGEMGVFLRTHDNGMIRIWLKSRFLNNSMSLSDYEFRWLGYCFRTRFFFFYKRVYRI